MGNLKVNSKTLQYKQTTYKIDHIKSVKIVETERNKHVNIPEPLDSKEAYSFRKFAFILFAVGIVIPFVFTYIDVSLFISIGLGVLLILFSKVSYSIAESIFDDIAKRDEEIKEALTLPTTEKFYGLSIRFPTDNGEVFWSSKRFNIKKAHDAVVEAMNSSSNTATMENVTIEISDSQEIYVQGYGS